MLHCDIQLSGLMSNYNVSQWLFHIAPFYEEISWIAMFLNAFQWLTMVDHNEPILTMVDHG